MDILNEIGWLMVTKDGFLPRTFSPPGLLGGLRGVLLLVVLAVLGLVVLVLGGRRSRLALPSPAENARICIIVI